MKKMRWKKTGSRVVYKNKWTAVIEDDVVTGDGRCDEYCYIDASQSVLCIVMDEHDKFFMVRHYRYPTESFEWEFPGGGVKRNESIRTSAKRELMEETGLTACLWKKIGTYNTWAFRTNEVISIYVAQRISSQNDPTDNEEEIGAQRWFSADEIAGLIAKGEIKNAQIIAAFFFVCQFLNRI